MPIRASPSRWGEEGIVHYRIGLYDDGRIRSCVVTVASGYERLDTATCELLVSSRFKSVRDDGQRVRSSHDGTMAWVLPATRRKAVPPPRTQPAGKELAAAERICRSERAEGSLVRERTYCLSQAEWTRLERRGRDMLLNFTSEMGGAVF